MTFFLNIKENYKTTVCLEDKSNTEELQAECYGSAKEQLVTSIGWVRVASG